MRKIAVLAVGSARHPRGFLKEPTYPYLQARYMGNGIYMGQIVGLCFRSTEQENLECFLGSSQVVRDSSGTWSSEASAMRRKVFKGWRLVP